MNFCGIDRNGTTYETARFAVLPVPYDHDLHLQSDPVRVLRPS
jgi:hypothetical protein